MACPKLDDRAAALALQFSLEVSQMGNLEKGIPPSQAALDCLVDLQDLRKIQRCELLAF